MLSASLMRSAVFLVVTLLAASWFTQHRFLLTQEYERATPAALAAGTAAAPFQYRVLVPKIAGFVAGPRSPLRVGLADAHRAIEWLAVVVLVLLFRAYLGALLGDGRLATWPSLLIFAPLASHYLIPRYGPYWYPSDLPGVALFTAGLLCLRLGAWRWYYPVFALATLNRETACFLGAFFLLTAWGRLPRKQLLGHAAAQALIWLGLKAMLALVYRGNPGAGLFEWHLASNLALLFELETLVLLCSAFAFLWIPCVAWVSGVRDDFVRRGFATLIPFLLGMLLVANLRELRVYGEMIPIVLSTFLVAMHELHAGGPAPLHPEGRAADD